MPAGCYQLGADGHAAGVGSGWDHDHGAAAGLGQQQGCHRLYLRVIIGGLIVAGQAYIGIAGARSTSQAVKNWDQPAMNLSRWFRAVR